jgi:hypothetical protein
LSQPGITSALTGASTIAHLAENIGESGWRIDKLSIVKIENIIQQEKNHNRIRQLKALRELLSQELSPDPLQAFLDLISIIETAVLQKVVAEETLFPNFIHLFQYRNKLNPGIFPDLQQIHEELREIIKFPNN